MHKLKKYSHIIRYAKSSEWKENALKIKMTRNSIKKYQSIFNVMNRIIDINILNKILVKNCKNNKSNEKNQKKKENNKKIDNNKHANNNTSNVKFVNIQVWKHRNMRVCSLRRHSTIHFKKAWYTILIVVIFLFTISNNLWRK
jgi:Fe2+ transport system protein B